MLDENQRRVLKVKSNNALVLDSLLLKTVASAGAGIAGSKDRTFVSFILIVVM